MNVLVTGGAGYIGCHVARHLRDSGHSPVILDDLSKGHAPSVGEFGLVRGSISRRELVVRTLVEHDVKAVVHLAASSLVGESVARPDVYFANNVCGGLELLRAMVEAGVRHIVFSSTAAVYGEPARIPISEECPEAPTSPYGESKLFFERILKWFDRAYQVRFISLRYFNAAGAHADGDIGEDHDPETHLIPSVLAAAMGEVRRLVVHGADYATTDGTCVRDYIDVWDLARAHTLALEALVDGGPSAVYNLGNGRGFSVLEVIRCAESVVGHRIPYMTGPRRAGDPAVLVAGSSRIEAELGWSPRTTRLADIIESAWKWHRGHPNGYAEDRTDGQGR